MRLYSYVVKYDRGLAPNPFWGYCTLALCTPNHMGIRPSEGDWIIGTTTKARGNKLLYAMKVSEVLPFDVYYNDDRFKKKKPNVSGTWRQQVGDNMYFKDEKGQWKQHRTRFHLGKEINAKDLKHPFAFIGKEFFYFGKNAVEMPLQFKSLILERQGCQYNFDVKTVENFIEWICLNFEYGIHGNPDDNEDCS